MLAFFLMVLISTNVFSGEHIGFYKIVQIDSGYGAEGVYAVLEKPFSSKCGDDGGAVVIALDHPLLKIMTTELITAFHAGYQAGFYIDGCVYGRSKVQAIGIKK